VVKTQIIIKTKCSHAQGMGDLTSSVVLGRELKKKAKQVVFLVNKDQKAIDFILKNNFFVQGVEGIEDIELFLQGKIFELAILNQLNTGKKELLLFKEHSKKLVTIEDAGAPSLLADLRFNILYPRPEAVTDPNFIPLADIFQKKHLLAKRIHKKIKNLLVVQGGCDTHGFIPKIAKALYGVDPQLRINIVLGPYFSHAQKLDDVLCNAPRKFNIISKCNDLSGLMMEADIAISAAGNTLFELACLGVPTIVICSEKFEEITAKILEARGVCINLGFGLNLDEQDIAIVLEKLIADYKLRFSLSRSGKRLIDGAGIKRIANRIEKLITQY